MGSARCALPVKRGGAPIELGKPEGFGRRKLGGFLLGANGTCPEKKSPIGLEGCLPPKKTLGVNTKWVFFLKFFFDV